MFIHPIITPSLSIFNILTLPITIHSMTQSQYLHFSHINYNYVSSSKSLRLLSLNKEYITKLVIPISLNLVVCWPCCHKNDGHFILSLSSHMTCHDTRCTDGHLMSDSFEILFFIFSMNQFSVWIEYLFKYSFGLQGKDEFSFSFFLHVGVGIPF